MNSKKKSIKKEINRIKKEEKIGKKEKKIKIKKIARE